jgi:hypothetical protein
MSDLAALDQNNWYAPASLVVQLAFLTAGVWFARNLIRTMRVSQEQFGAMLKSSIMGAAGERNVSNGNAAQSATEVSPYWLAPSETEAAGGLPEQTQSGPNRVTVGHFTVARRKIVLWLQAPMSTVGTAPWRRIITWLQAPAGS